jgi:hypothetical protein
MRTVLSEMRPADASLPKSEYRLDQRLEERSNGQGFLRVDVDCVMLFQIIRIVLWQA